MTTPTATLAGEATGTGSSGTFTATITTGTVSGATARGATLLAWVTTAAGTITGIADPVNGAWYPKTAAETEGVISGQWWEFEGAAILPSSTTITGTFSSSSSQKSIQVIEVNGAGPVDVAAASGAVGTGTAVSATSGTLTQAAELVLCGEANASGGGAIAWTGALAGAGIASQHAGSSQWSGVAAVAVSATTPVACTGTIGGSSIGWLASVITLKAGPGSYGRHGVTMSNDSPYSNYAADISGWGSQVYPVTTTKIFMPGSVDGSTPSNYPVPTTSMTLTQISQLGAGMNQFAATLTLGIQHCVCFKPGNASGLGSGAFSPTDGGALVTSVTAMAAVCAAYGCPPPMICLYAEANSGNDWTAATFQAMYQHYYPGLSAIPGVLVVYCMLSGKYANSSLYFPGPTIASPGTTLACDIATVDMYGTDANLNLDSTPGAFQAYTSIANYAGVPFGVWENGSVGHTGVAPSRASTVAFLLGVQEVLATRVANGWDNAGYHWFQSAGGPGGGGGGPLDIITAGTAFTYTATLASPAVFTASGAYTPNDGDPVQLASSAGVPQGFAATQTYYVVGASGQAFSLDTSSSGPGITSASATTAAAPATAIDFRIPLLQQLYAATSNPPTPPPSTNVTVVGSNSYAVAYSLTAGEPANASLPMAVDNIAGDWMIAVIAWRQAESGAAVTVTVEDDQHNWWEPLGPPAADSAPAGVTRCAVWAAPAALAADWVVIAPTGLVLGLACIVLDVADMAPWLTVAGIATGYANAATALTVGIGAPTGVALAIAVNGADNVTDTIGGPGGSWVSVAQVDATNGTDDTDDIVLNAAYQFTSGAVSAAWTSSGSQDLSAVTVAVLVSGTPPTFPQQYWPAVIPEVAPGAGFQTPPSELAWVPLASPVTLLDFSHQQGAPYLLGQLQAGQGTMTIDDPQGQLIPPGAGAYAGIDSGTPARLRTAWQGGQWQVQFTGNGTTAGPQIDSGQYTPVVPGQSYGTGGWIACSVPYAAGLTLQISWWNSGGGFISADVAPQVADDATPVLAIASGIAPAGAARFSVTIIAAGTPASSVVFSAAAAEPYSSGYLNVPAGAPWAGTDGAVVSIAGPWVADEQGPPVPCPNAVAWSGFFQQLPPGWERQLLRGQVTATITDVWGYANKQLKTILRSEILLDDPVVYWPGTDLAGSQFASDITTGPVPLALTVSKYGSAGAGGTFGQSPSAPLVGDGSSSMFEQTLGGTALAGSGYGYCLSAQLQNAPPVHSGITVDCFLQPGFASAPAFATVIWTLYDGKGPVLSLGLAAATGYLTLTSWSAAGVPSTQTIFSPQAWYNSTAPLYFVVTFGRTGWKAYVTGATGGYATGTFPNEIRATFSLVNWMGNFSRWLTGGQMAGYWGHGAIYPSRLPPSRWAAHQYAGQTALEFAGTAQGPEAVTSRVERLLGIGSMPGRRLIIPETGVDVTYAASASDISGNTTTSTTGTANTSGNTASAALTNMAASTVPAVLNITPTGAVMYLAKQYVYNQPVKWVFGTRPDLGEIPFTPVITGGYDPARAVNDISITQEDTQAVTVPDQDQQPSQDQYGDQTYQITGYLAYDATEGYGGLPGLQDLADYIFATLGTPHVRIPAVSVLASSNPAAWNCWARAAAGDMVTVNWRPPTNPGLVFSMTGRMTQVTKALKFSLDGVEGSLEGAIDYAPEENCLTCDDPIRGQLNGTNILGW